MKGLVATCLLLLLLGLGLFLFLGHDTAIPEQTPASPSRIADTELPSNDTSTSAEQSNPGQRQTLPENSPSEPAITFAAFLEQLVHIALQIIEADAKGEDALAKKLDKQGKELLAQVWMKIPAPDEEALQAITGLAASDTKKATTVRRTLCLQFIQKGLGRRYQRWRLHGQGQALHLLLAAILNNIPQDEWLAQELGSLLIQQPYLGLEEEHQILALVEMAPEDRFLLATASELLLTLWHNLEAQGIRQSGELERLALMFKDDANPCRRLAAFRYLMANSAEYREQILTEAMQSGDSQLIAALAKTAAELLDPEEAMRSLARLAEVSGRQVMPAVMTLAGRQPGVLQQQYQTHLAANSRAGFRAELISGAGFQGGTQGVDLAKQALRQDPDPEVRARALLVISAKADMATARQDLQAAIQTAASQHQPQLGNLILALENLANRSDADASGAAAPVRELAQQLLAFPQLSNADRQRLEGMEK